MLYLSHGPVMYTSDVLVAIEISMYVYRPLAGSTSGVDSTENLQKLKRGRAARVLIDAAAVN